MAGATLKKMLQRKVLCGFHGFAKCTNLGRVCSPAVKSALRRNDTQVGVKFKKETSGMPLTALFFFCLFYVLGFCVLFCFFVLQTYKKQFLIDDFIY